MHRMSVIRGQKKAVLIKAALPEPVFIRIDIFQNNFQKLLQKRGICALLRSASNFFIVKQRIHTDKFFRLRCQKSAQRRISTLQIVQTRRADQGIVRSHDAPFIPVIHIQIAAKNLLFRHVCRFCAQLFDRKLLIQPHQRCHVCLRIVCKAIVDFPVKMNRYIGNYQQVFFQIDELCFRLSIFSGHKHTTGNGKRAIQPRA